MSELPQPASTELTIAASGPNGINSTNWNAFHQFSCQLALEIPVPGFTVVHLLRLAPNDVIDTHWAQGADVALLVNGKLIGWTEFEVMDDRLAARLTQIA